MSIARYRLGAMSDTVTITHEIATYPGETTVGHLWSISEDGDRIAELWADTVTAEILQVWTREDRRGQGLATALYRQATSEMVIYHAPASHRTDDGARFAIRVGGPETTCTCCDHLDDGQDY